MSFLGVNNFEKHGYIVYIYEVNSIACAIAMKFFENKKVISYLRLKQVFGSTFDHKIYR